MCVNFIHKMVKKKKQKAKSNNAENIYRMSFVNAKEYRHGKCREQENIEMF